MVMYAMPAEKEKQEAVQSSHLSAAEAFSMELAKLFDDAEYYENAAMDSWGVTREFHHFSVSWHDPEGLEHSAVHEWHKLYFPDGSELFVLVGDGVYLSLPSHLEPQHQAALLRKASSETQIDQRLANFYPTGPRN